MGVVEVDEGLLLVHLSHIDYAFVFVVLAGGVGDDCDHFLCGSGNRVVLDELEGEERAVALWIFFEVHVELYLVIVVEKVAVLDDSLVWGQRGRQDGFVRRKVVEIEGDCTDFQVKMTHLQSAP
jgi:hypothetical protein